MIDPHRLTVFYQVVRHGGMAAVARKLPVLGSLPALSRQISRLEEEIGARLFTRTPFRLTPVGRKLYEPLPDIAGYLLQSEQSARAIAQPSFRIGVEEELRQSLLLLAAPAWLQEHPQTPVQVQPGTAGRLHAAFAAGELDFILTLEQAVAEGRKTEDRRQKAADRVIPQASAISLPPSGAGRRILGTRPLVLLVPKTSRIREAGHLWQQKRITERLAAPPPDHPVMRSLQAGLRQGGIEWPTQILTDSLSHVLPFVAAGLGVGFTFDLPVNTQHPRVRALPIPGFVPVAIACHWRRPENPQIRTALRRATAILAGDRGGQ